jgi:hypothetical protein
MVENSPSIREPVLGIVDVPDDEAETGFVIDVSVGKPVVVRNQGEARRVANASVAHPAATRCAS